MPTNGEKQNLQNGAPKIINFTGVILKDYVGVLEKQRFILASFRR